MRIHEPDKRKRHCMVVHAYYPLGEVRVEREAHALLKDGYQVDVIALQGEKEPLKEMIDGVCIYRFPVRRNRGRSRVVQMLEYIAFFLMAFFKLTSLHIKERYSSVQVHNLPDFLVFCALVPKLTGTPVILDLHDLMPEFYAATSKNGMQSFAVRLLLVQEKLATAFADHVITVTNLWKDTLVQRSVPEHKVSVVMNVADPVVFDRNSFPRRGGNSNGHFKLIYHGTITHRYGADILLQAVDRLRAEIPGIHVTIHGQGEYLDELQKLAQSLNLENHVRFSVDYVPTNVLPQMILDSDLGVVPYRSNIFTDGILPTKLMEYVALGVPVIAARTPAIEAYFDDSMVRFFKPGETDELVECLRQLYQDRSRLDQLAENADRFNKDYSWESISACYVATVNRLTKK